MGLFAYYNEHDPFAAAWLRELIKAGQITDGEVDERDIQQVQPEDVRGFTRCHFFAGIGGWDLALRLAEWPEDRPVWTGSCPCQPFSAAGQNKGGADDRHLWPHWARLIRECRPATIVGEQVDAAVAHGWLDAVFDELEALDYACGAVDLPAASVGAPHRRQRIWFVAESSGAERRSGRTGRNGADRSGAYAEPAGPSDVGSLAHHHHRRRESLPRTGLQRPAVYDAHGRGAECGMAYARGARSSQLSGERDESEGFAATGDLGDVADTLRQRGQQIAGGASGDEAADGRTGRDGREPHGDHVAAGHGKNGFWSACDWLPCRDGKWRPVEPGTFPLVARLPKGVVRSGDPGAPCDANESAEARVMRLRGYGNAVVPQVAAEVIAAYLEISR